MFWEKRAFKAEFTRLLALQIGREDHTFQAFGAANSLHEQFRRAGLLPIKRSLSFDALVARVTGPDILDPELQSYDDFVWLAHLVFVSRVMINGSRVPDGPYGDLFHRVLVGYGGVIDGICDNRFGSTPEFDPYEPIGPPHVREFLDTTAGRYADGLTEQVTGTHTGAFCSILKALSEHFESDPPPMIKAVAGQTPAVRRPDVPNVGWHEDVTYEDILQSTSDEQLSAALASAQPV